MRKKTLNTVFRTSVLMGIAVLSSCQENLFLDTSGIDDINSTYIDFNNYVGDLTRASMAPGKGSFKLDDTMAVWGVQKTGQYTDLVFKNQKVTNVGGAQWTYSPKKQWNYTSKYTFYGVYPYSTTRYTMDMDNDFLVSIPTYTTDDDPDKQIDLMISEKRAISPGNTVDMIFHHILSNVNVITKIGADFETTDIDSVAILRLNLNNIQNTGKYDQSGWDANNQAVGAWSNTSGIMTWDTIFNRGLSLDKTKTDTVYKDYLMMPQKLFSTESRPQDATLDVIFKIFYKDETSSTFVKEGLRLAGVKANNLSTNKIVSEWEPNYRYNYLLAINPHKSTRIWNADGDGSLQIDPNTGDTIKYDDDTPTPGTMQYNPDEPDFIYVYEDSDDDDDDIPDTWNKYPVAWEDIDGDGLLEGGIDRDGDGHIDNVDGDTDTLLDNNPNKDPTDGDPTNNPEGKEVILVHYDSNGDGVVDDNDEWGQVQKDPDTGEIVPAKEIEDNFIEFTATVSEWVETDTIIYNINK